MRVCRCLIIQMDTRPSVYAPHHKYTLGVAHHVRQLRVRDKRTIYATMRLQPEVKTDSFLPHFGLCVSDFSVWQILNEKPREGARIDESL